MTADFRVYAFTSDDFECLVYLASERQVHQHDGGMDERVSFTSGVAGYVLDPEKYPKGTRFLLVRKEH